MLFLYYKIAFRLSDNDDVYGVSSHAWSCPVSLPGSTRLALYLVIVYLAYCLVISDSFPSILLSLLVNKVYFLEITTSSPGILSRVQC